MTVSGLTISNADPHSVHRRARQPEGTVRGTEAELMATAGALQDQERMTQGQDFSFES